ncbi:MAG: adenylate/guanylate cyclase domain-containing protein [Spirochaetes bacterium]|nr:adenylate/guanylate cyclase domain-containing protein [Spirochaetota bacterium]
MTLKFEKHHIIGLILSLALGITFAIIYSQTRIFDRMEVGTVDTRFWLRDPSEKSVAITDKARRFAANPKARKDIVIIGIDETTIREFSDRGINWPFPWNKHALLTDFLSSGQPLSIFFDIMFLDKKPHEEELAKAIRRAGNVFLDYPFETEDLATNYQDHQERIALMQKTRWPVEPAMKLDKKDELVEEAVPPRPILSSAARGIGFANIFPDEEDKVNRKMPLVMQHDGWLYPNIDLMVIMHYFGIGPKDVEIKLGKYIKLKNLPRGKMAVPNEKREIDIPIDKYGFMDINFIGGPGSFNSYSYSYFCRDGSMGDNESLRNKILLVAAYASTGIAEDVKPSPYGPTFGIEHHANALNTVLNQDFIYRFSNMQNIFIILLIALLLGLITPRMSIIFSSVVTVAVFVAVMLASLLLFFYWSIIIATAVPLIQTGLTFTFIITYRLLTEQKEKKYIRQTFSKFVSKSVVDELLKHPEKLKLGGDKKILTVLFSDIRGFTTLSEKMTPEQLVEHLNVYLQAMTDIVIKTNGTLDKYVGDEIMAFWGAPIPQDNHAMLACGAALEMMKELDRLNALWQKEGKPRLDIGIGLNTGDMVVGNMGSASRMDYTLMGDNVNLGARLEGTNKIYSTNIIISEFTYEHVKDQIIARELDLIRVKGKALPVKIYELIDIK